MIARIWRGAVAQADGDAYADYIDETGMAAYTKTPGNRGAWMLRRDVDGKTEFLMFTLWDSMEAIKAFAGDEPGGRRVLSRGRSLPGRARRVRLALRGRPIRVAVTERAGSSRWAAAGSRWSPRTRCSTSSCCRWRARPVPTCASCRPRAATTRDTSPGSIGRSPRTTAGPPIFSCSSGRSATSSRSCSRRTSIYVGGGNTANMLAVWRAQGLDHVLRRAWEEGVVLCGLSAGMNCWFEESVTDSFSLERAGAAARRPRPAPRQRLPPLRRRGAAAARRITRLVAAGELSGGWAADDGAALVFAGRELVEIVASRPHAGAWRVDADRRRRRQRAAIAGEASGRLTTGST